MIKVAIALLDSASALRSCASEALPLLFLNACAQRLEAPNECVPTETVGTRAKNGQATRPWSQPEMRSVGRPDLHLHSLCAEAVGKAEPRDKGESAPTFG